MASGGSSVSSGGGVAERYATALYGIAEDERQLDPVIDQMNGLGRLIDQNADLRRLLASPLIDMKTALKALRATYRGLREKRTGRAIPVVQPPSNAPEISAEGFK